MFKKSLVFIFLAVCLLLSACSKNTANDLNLSLVEDGKGEKNYIYYDDERIVYVVGGIMMAEIEESPIMLDTALFDGKITLAQIISTAKADADDEDIQITEYPDGSIEYHYDTFDLVVLNTADANRDIYFVPKSMSYYDCIN